MRIASTTISMRTSRGFSPRIRRSARQLQDVCSRALQGFRLLSVLIAPVLPDLAERVARELFGLDRPFAWIDADVLPARINPYQHLMTRVDPKQLDALFETDDEPAPASDARGRRSTRGGRRRSGAHRVRRRRAHRIPQPWRMPRPWREI